MRSIRAFVALYPDAPALEAIVAFRDRLRAAMPQRGCRWAKDDQLHLTLRFIGELPTHRLGQLQADLARSCHAGGALRVTATFTGAPWKGARVVALEIKGRGERLARLQGRIEANVREAGVPPEPKPFHPHLTLARLEDPRLQPGVERNTVAEWEAIEILLMQSELGPGGATHSVLGRFPLQ